MSQLLVEPLANSYEQHLTRLTAPVWDFQLVVVVFFAKASGALKPFGCFTPTSCIGHDSPSANHLVTQTQAEQSCLGPTQYLLQWCRPSDFLTLSVCCFYITNKLPVVTDTSHLTNIFPFATTFHSWSCCQNQNKSILSYFNDDIPQCSSPPVCFLILLLFLLLLYALDGNVPFLTGWEQYRHKFNFRV